MRVDAKSYLWNGVIKLYEERLNNVCRGYDVDDDDTSARGPYVPCGLSLIHI